MSVLDVASGPGTVARIAAAAVGSDGRVVASDISSAMLAVAAATASGVDATPVEIVECSATDLKLADATFEMVLCQQGLQFFGDRPSAVREIHRVLRFGGVALVSTCAAERPLVPMAV
jgi:ubiquinone/menaquinone biosynthesis C-methylase UbiE